jgi:hypothetical protein
MNRFAAATWAALAAFFIACGPAHADFEFSDIACETTTTAGTGTVDLAGALTGGYLGFLAAGIESGDTVPYHIKDGSQLETGIGTFTDATPDTLSRTAFLSTDGSGAELTLSGGTATVCIGPTTQIWTGGASWAMSIGTSGTFTTGTIELGSNGTDTTLARAAAGDVTIEGDAVKRSGTETIWIPANAISPVTDTYGQCTYSVPAVFGGVDNALASCLYNDGAYDIGAFTIRMPKNWDEGNLVYQVYWGTSATSGDVAWKLNCYSYGENEALTAYSSTQEIDDTAMGTANRLAITAASSAFACQGTPAAGDILQFRFYRDYADAGDTLAADARLWGVLITYTSDAANDD